MKTAKLLLITLTILIIGCDNSELQKKENENNRLKSEISSLSEFIEFQKEEINKLERKIQSINSELLQLENKRQREVQDFLKRIEITDSLKLKLQELNFSFENHIAYQNDLISNYEYEIKLKDQEILKYITVLENIKRNFDEKDAIIIEREINDIEFNLQKSPNESKNVILEYVKYVVFVIVLILILALVVLLFISIFSPKSWFPKVARLLSFLMAIFIYFVSKKLDYSIPDFLLYSLEPTAFYIVNTILPMLIGYFATWYIINAIKTNGKKAIRVSILMSTLLIIVLVEVFIDSYITNINSHFLLPNATFIFGIILFIVFRIDEIKGEKITITSMFKKKEN